MPPKPDYQLIAFASAKEWTKWLAANHAAAPGVWIKFARKGGEIASVVYAEALEAALCYGWIDGQNASLGADWWKQKFTPRAARSKWSKVNCEKAEALIAAKKMKPAGLKEVERAKADGRWAAAYDRQGAAVVPPDLARALAKDKAAKAFFATLDSKNRYAILHRIQTAVKPETRARRIETFVAMLGRQEKIHG